MTDKEAPKASEAAGWLSLTLKVLSLLERLLPTILLSWAHHLKAKNKELEQKLRLEEVGNDVEAKRVEVEEKGRTQDARATIDDFLRR